MDTRLALKNCLGFALTEEEQQIVESTSQETIQKINRYIIEQAATGSGDDLEMLVEDLGNREKVMYLESDLSEEEKQERIYAVECQTGRFFTNMLTGRSTPENLLGPSIRQEADSHSSTDSFTLAGQNGKETAIIR